MRKLYSQRLFLRTLEKGWTGLEGWTNRLTTAGDKLRPYNPLYHLGTLAIFLMLVLTVTGLYLVLFYRPGTDRAYETIAAISANPLGSLMRSAHRYAADGLILVTLLHALKMLVSDRFWGSRWLAWLSGWAMLTLFWIIGVTGYWLVWDARAQWLTEYAIQLFGGSFALSFLGPEVAARTFSLFVIILFLHVFLPILFVIGLLVHVLRLTRVRLWAPRWLLVETGLVLLLLSLLRPVSSALPVDFGRLLPGMSLDWWYLGFLPLVDQWGNPLFWGLSLLLLAGLGALPWLAGSRPSAGPAVILNPSCSGCALCARECPYEAIEMVGRDDGSGYQQVARINPDLCTGCGICVGTCSTVGVELEAYHTDVLQQDLRRALEQAGSRGEQPGISLVVFTCERHTVLDSVPALVAAEDAETPALMRLLQAQAAPRVQVSSGKLGRAPTFNLVSCSLPCAGMVNAGWVRQTLAEGAAGALVLACPADDCSYREGTLWIGDRLSRRRSLREANVLLLEVAPGGKKEVEQALLALHEGQGAHTEARELAASRPEGASLLGWLARARYLAAGTALVAVCFLLALVLDWPAAASPPEQAALRVATSHGGLLLATADSLPEEILAKLPANVDPAQVLGGERFPVHLRLLVDGAVVLEEIYQPQGLRREGAIAGLADWWLPPGRRQVQLWLMDDGKEWELAFDETLQIGAGERVTLLYQERTRQFERVGGESLSER